MEEIKSGVLGSFQDNINDKDRELVGIELPVLELQDDIRYAYNQYKRKEDNMSCTIFSACASLGNTVNHNFSNTEISELNELSYTEGRRRGDGRHLPKAVDLVRRYRNERNPQRQVASFRVKAFDSDRKQFMEKGYNGCTVYNGDGEYNKDKNKDGILDGTKFGNTYGHAVCVGRDGQYGRVRDSNYGTNKYWKYKLEDYKKLIENSVFMNYVYFFVELKAIEKTKEQLTLESRIRATEKIIGDTQKIINNGEYKLLNYATLEKINKQYEIINQLHREWLAGA